MTLLWDWNGTLLDDTGAAVGALAAILERRGLAPVPIEEYRATFSFPSRKYYERVGLDLEAEDWNALAEEYHAAYLALPRRLAADAAEALDFAAESGCAQYIISAMRQDLLESEVARFGLAGRFAAIYGTDNLDGGSKIASARRLSAILPPGGATVIGDALHDKEAADAIGAKCVFYSGGSHCAGRLAAAGPVAGTLVNAVRTAIAIMSEGEERGGNVV